MVADNTFQCSMGPHFEIHFAGPDNCKYFIQSELNHDATRKTFSVATTNVRGLTNHTKQEALSRDIDKYKTDICCLQETKMTENFDKTTTHGNQLITIPSNRVNITAIVSF